MCGVGKFQKIWKLKDTDACPHCGQPEDSYHVWTCKADSVHTLWEQSLNKLRNHLLCLDTDPTIMMGIIHYLQSWRSDTSLKPLQDTSIQQMLSLQDTRGIRQFFEGWWHGNWELLQQQYYTSINSHRNGKRWTIAIITKLWEIAWDIWEFCNAVLHEQENITTETDNAAINARINDLLHTLSNTGLRPKDRHLAAITHKKIVTPTEITKIGMD